MERLVFESVIGESSNLHVHGFLGVEVDRSALGFSVIASVSGRALANDFLFSREGIVLEIENGVMVAFVVILPLLSLLIERLGDIVVSNLTSEVHL